MARSLPLNPSPAAKRFGSLRVMKEKSASVMRPAKPYARVMDGKVTEVIDGNQFDPKSLKAMIDRYRPCGPDVAAGWTMDADGNFAAPADAKTAAPKAAPKAADASS